MPETAGNVDCKALLANAVVKKKQQDGKFDTLTRRAQERWAWSKRPVEELVQDQESAQRFVCCGGESTTTCRNEMCVLYHAVVEARTAVAKAELDVAQAPSAVEIAQSAVEIAQSAVDQAQSAVVDQAQSAVVESILPQPASTSTITHEAEPTAPGALVTALAEELRILQQQSLQDNLKNMEATLAYKRNSLEDKRNILEDKRKILEVQRNILEARAHKLHENIKFFNLVISNVKHAGNQMTYQTQRTGAPQHLGECEEEEEAGTTTLSYLEQKLDALTQEPYGGPSYEDDEQLQEFYIFCETLIQNGQPANDSRSKHFAAEIQSTVDVIRSWSCTTKMGNNTQSHFMWARRQQPFNQSCLRSWRKS
jgi:hypothetical protein